MSFSKFANVVSRLPYEVPDSRIGESKNLGVFDRLASQAFVCDSAFHVYYVSNLVEEPGIDSAEFRDFFDGHPGFESFNRVEDSLVCCSLSSFLILLGLRPRSLTSVSSLPKSSIRIAFWRASSKHLPMAMTSPTDFIWVPIPLLAFLNFRKSQRGAFTTM